ncbi:MAG: 4-alpha-glucanotransferase, partial [Oscillospiraceae bacterium]|nr:4-alpha-glucanotransferase [Oscillospiraceae bacterium]
DNFDKSYDTIIRLMLMSRANLVVFPIQDLLGYGSDTRLNTPGKAEGNWSYRITREQLMGLNRERFLNLNRQYSRI